jgi:hypothetical protein
MKKIAWNLEKALALLHNFTRASALKSVCGFSKNRCENKEIERRFDYDITAAALGEM